MQSSVNDQICFFVYMQYVFDYKEGDVFACMSDLGWLSGHTSVVYGPLCNGATTVLFEGTATHPNEGLYNQNMYHMCTFHMVAGMHICACM